jgi:hypothetical protein
MESAEGSGKDGILTVEAAMVIYMDDYRKAKAMKVAGLRRYDDELLCVNWNPAIAVIGISRYQSAQELSPQLPEDLTTVDVRAFLDRVYALASQI